MAIMFSSSHSLNLLSYAAHGGSNWFYKFVDEILDCVIIQMKATEKCFPMAVWWLQPLSQQMKS